MSRVDARAFLYEGSSTSLYGIVRIVVKFIIFFLAFLRDDLSFVPSMCEEPFEGVDAARPLANTSLSVVICLKLAQVESFENMGIIG